MVAFDSFTGFVYQAFIVSPAVSWILHPGRFSPRRGFFYAVALLVALAAVSIVRQLTFIAPSVLALSLTHT